MKIIRMGNKKKYVKEWIKRNVERIKQTVKKRLIKHPEKRNVRRIKQTVKKPRIIHPEKRKQWNKNYRDKVRRKLEEYEKLKNATSGENNLTPISDSKIPIMKEAKPYSKNYARHLEWRQKNPEKAKAIKKRYESKNPEKLKQYYKIHRDKIRKKLKEYDELVKTHGTQNKLGKPQ